MVIFGMTGYFYIDLNPLSFIGIKNAIGFFTFTGIIFGFVAGLLLNVIIIYFNH